MQPTTPLVAIATKESFIERFGDWITGLFHSSEIMYNSLLEEEKKAGVWASGIIALISTNLDTEPTAVIALFQLKFPDLSLDVVHGFLDNLRIKLDNLQSEIALTLQDAIAWGQKFLAQHVSDTGTFAVIRTTAVNILAIMFSPETAVEKFIEVGLYIYHMIVKPHIAATT